MVPLDNSCIIISGRYIHQKRIKFLMIIIFASSTLHFCWEIGKKIHLKTVINIIQGKTSYKFLNNFLSFGDHHEKLCFKMFQN